jgi:hypothetical protein
MIFTSLKAVTKDCPDCISGREVISYWKKEYSLLEAAKHFYNSKEYNPARSYLIRDDPNYLVFTVLELEEISTWNQLKTQPSDKTTPNDHD